MDQSERGNRKPPVMIPEVNCHVVPINRIDCCQLISGYNCLCLGFFYFTDNSKFLWPYIFTDQENLQKLEYFVIFYHMSLCKYDKIKIKNSVFKFPQRCIL